MTLSDLFLQMQNRMPEDKRLGTLETSVAFYALVDVLHEGLMFQKDVELPFIGRFQIKEKKHGAGNSLYFKADDTLQLLANQIEK